jgi:hypothetical protein
MVRIMRQIFFFLSLKIVDIHLELRIDSKRVNKTDFFVQIKKKETRSPVLLINTHQ